jgi:hypothetical protein
VATYHDTADDILAGDLGAGEARITLAEQQASVR